jgi:hypothetical protein
MQQANPNAEVPTPPTAPLRPAQVQVDGVQLMTNGQAIYQAFRAQRRELQRQMEGLQDTRGEIARELSAESITDAEKRGLEQRLGTIDERIAALDKQIMEADAQVAKAAAVPGAAIEPPSPPDTGPDEGVFVVASIFVFVVLMPIALAYSRRIWKRTAKVITTFPKELSDRLIRVEQAVEATAVEVERIGEGQRFMTRLFTEGPAAQQLGGGQASQRIPAAPQTDR